MAPPKFIPRFQDINGYLSGFVGYYVDDWDEYERIVAPKRRMLSNLPPCKTCRRLADERWPWVSIYAYGYAPVLVFLGFDICWRGKADADERLKMPLIFT